MGMQKNFYQLSALLFNAEVHRLWSSLLTGIKITIFCGNANNTSPDMFSVDQNFM